MGREWCDGVYTSGVLLCGFLIKRVKVGMMQLHLAGCVFVSHLHITVCVASEESIGEGEMV